jgi:hypothetical protein
MPQPAGTVLCLFIRIAEHRLRMAVFDLLWALYYNKAHWCPTTSWQRWSCCHGPLSHSGRRSMGRLAPVGEGQTAFCPDSTCAPRPSVVKENRHASTMCWSSAAVGIVRYVRPALSAYAFLWARGVATASRSASVARRKAATGDAHAAHRGWHAYGAHQPYRRGRGGALPGHCVRRQNGAGLGPGQWQTAPDPAPTAWHR